VLLVMAINLLVACEEADSNKVATDSAHDLNLAGLGILGQHQSFRPCNHWTNLRPFILFVCCGRCHRGGSYGTDFLDGQYYSTVALLAVPVAPRRLFVSGPPATRSSDNPSSRCRSCTTSGAVPFSSAA
jgi:hypothetical protein